MAASHADHALGLGKSAMIAGIGCRRGVTAEEVLLAIRSALSEYDLAIAKLEAVAILAQKGDEHGVSEAARILGLPLLKVSPNEILITHSRSERSLAATGQHSASEAAALAATRSGGRLIGPRIIVGPVTCAIALGACE